MSALGVETGTLVHVTGAALGVSSLVATSAVAFSVLRYAGAAYLVYLGVRTGALPMGGLEPETIPVLLFPLWGSALGAATLAYHYRRRGPCRRCGRG